MKQAATIAVVVPVYNEAVIVPELIERLTALTADPRVELIVVDGGSTDGSAENLRSARLPVLSTACGRATQMNAGADQTRAPLLLFLHADTALPPGAIDAASDAVDRGALWGRFNIRIAGSSRWFPLISAMINVRTRLSGHATGDQAMFVRRATFDGLGRFPNQPLMEDVELSRRLRRLGRPACLSTKVTTSGRRWETNGVWRTVLLMWRLRFAYWRGVPADELAAFYA